MFIRTYETAADDCWLSWSSTPVHSQTHQVISTPHFVDRRKKRLIQTLFFITTSVEAQLNLIVLTKLRTTVISIRLCVPLLLSILQRLWVCMACRHSCSVTVGRLRLLLWLHVWTAYLYLHRPWKSWWVNLYRTIYSLTRVSFHPLVDVHNMSAQTMPLSEVLASSDPASEGCLFSTLDLSCDHHRMLRATQEDLETVRYYTIPTY